MMVAPLLCSECPRAFRASARECHRRITPRRRSIAAAAAGRSHRLVSTAAGGGAPSKVRIVEVGPRDGLQNEPRTPDAHGKVELIRKLHRAGCRHIEVGSLVSPKWVPSMADTEQVLQGLREWRREESSSSDPETRLSVLVPNARGLAKALGYRDVVDEIAVFASASESFSRRNLACSIDESFERFRAVVDAAARDASGEGEGPSSPSPRRRPLLVRGYVSCVIACPYEGGINPRDVARVAERLAELGCYEVSLGDTIGVGTPGSVRAMLREVQAAVSSRQQPDVNLAVHYHDTYGQALSNILVSLEEAGVSAVDSSVAGLGGCPYAKGATGNAATEDVVYMLNGLGVETGIDLDRLVDASEFVCGLIGQKSRSRAGTAIAARRLSERG